MRVYKYAELLMEIFIFISTMFLCFLYVFGLMSLLIAVDAFVISSLWPIVIPSLFPGLVEKGLLAKTVGFSNIFWFIVMLVVIKPVNISGMFSKTNKKGDKDYDKR